MDGVGKEDEENLRADVNIDVELREVPVGREVMKDPSSLVVHRPERTRGRSAHFQFVPCLHGLC